MFIIFCWGTMQAYCYHILISSNFPCSKVAMSHPILLSGRRGLVL